MLARTGRWVCIKSFEVGFIVNDASAIETVNSPLVYPSKWLVCYIMVCVCACVCASAQLLWANPGSNDLLHRLKGFVLS